LAATAASILVVALVNSAFKAFLLAFALGIIWGPLRELN